jgi:hypothetical protein
MGEAEEIRWVWPSPAIHGQDGPATPLRSPHVEFRSDAFPARPGEEQQINPGRWGAALVEYLKQELASRGYEGHASPIASVLRRPPSR